MFKALIKIVLVLAILGGGYYFLFERQPEVLQIPDIEEVSFEDLVDVATDAAIDALVNEDETPAGDVDTEQDDQEAVLEEQPTQDVPAQFKLAVPFTSQAPTANWSLPYQEACEEASLYMVSEYYQGTPSGQVDTAVADAAILDLVQFQEDFFGYYLDTTAQETVRVADAYFTFGATVVENPTVEMIKAEIAAGRPVIVPAAGRQLDNPYFSGEGPLYHMFVIKGYTETSFITNDPGTRNGNDFAYLISNVMSAMGDWNDGNPASGAKRVIFTSP